MQNEIERLHVVVGASMKPFFMPGTLVKVAKADERILKVGDVVCFSWYSDKSSRMHRIRKIVIDSHGKKLFKLRGDNLINYDGFFPIEAITGVVVAQKKSAVLCPFSIKDRYIGLFLSPFLFFFRKFIRESIANLMPLIFPYLKLKKIETVTQRNIRISLFWRSIRIAYKEDKLFGVHPLFISSKIRKGLSKFFN